MSNKSDLKNLMEQRGLPPTPHRLAVLAVLTRADQPLKATDVLRLLKGRRAIDRVTVYRILDLLVEKHLAERLSSGDRSFRYGLAAGIRGEAHAHFYCTTCGEMECLTPNLPGVDESALSRLFQGRIEKVEVRIDGTCQACLKGRGEG